MAVNIVLISTYELGRQPFGLASPAAWLRKRGHRVVALDLARQSLDESAIGAAGLIAIYLPMHTATRLAARSEEHTSELQSRLHLVCRLLLEKKKKTAQNSSDRDERIRSYNEQTCEEHTAQYATSVKDTR